MVEYKVYKPAKSNGGKFLIATTIGIAILLMVILVFTYPSIQSISFLILMLGIFIALIAIFAYLIYAYYEMEYLLSNEFLLIKWGLKTTKIPINNVKRIIRPDTRDYEGIRIGGVGLPGYLLGKFKYLIEGNFETVSLYVTKLDHLLFIETNNGNKKFYGISPSAEEEFLSSFKNLNEKMAPQITEDKIPFKSSKSSNRDIKLALSLFIVSIVLSLTGLIYFFVIYFQLPQIIPLHFGINSIPDRYGNKIDLIGVFVLFVIFGIGFSSLLYYYIHKRTHLDQTKYGYTIMILPVAIVILFLVISIITLNITLVYV
jgi:hypothetical protein